MIWENVSVPVGSKQWLTRLICWSVLLAGGVALWTWGSFVLSIFAPEEAVRPLIDRYVWLALGSAVWWYLARAILRAWRKCERCQRRLFDEPVWRQPPVDYRARPLMNRYAYAAMWQVIRHGSARCMWCGHVDGATPDYIVTTSQ